MIPVFLLLFLLFAGLIGGLLGSTKTGKRFLWGAHPTDKSAVGLSNRAIYNRWGEIEGAKYIAQRDEAESWRYRRILWLRDHPELTPEVASIITEDDARYIYGDEAVNAFKRRHTT